MKSLKMSHMRSLSNNDLPRLNECKTKRKLFVFICVSVALFSCTPQTQKEVRNPHPNIVYILADDLGYGDIRAYNSESKIPTPNLDRLASQGMRFTDAHSPSSVCTPTRYGILTGRYAWRSRLPRGVLRGYGPALIEKNETTVAEVLSMKQYQTAVVGKWHLGVDWAYREGFGKDDAWPDPLPEGFAIPGDIDTAYLDFNRPVSNIPNDHGFDYSFILPASLDFEPYCYLENGQLTAPLTAYTAGNDLNTGYTEAFWRPGKMAEGFDFYQVLPTFIQKANDFISEQSATEDPFFLYLPLPAPHTPWVPTAEFDDKAQAGTYGDFVHMVDHAVGQVLKKLDELNLTENTMVVFTSDNGPFWRPNMIERYQHRAAGNLRGMKADIWDGGHRVPFMVRWPNRVNPATVSNALVSLTDFRATITEMLGLDAEMSRGKDSNSLLNVLLEDEHIHHGRESIVHHSSAGKFAIRVGNWKLIPSLGSGGFSEPRFREPEEGEAPGQLYNLAEDILEENNLYAQEAERVESMMKLLEKIKNN